MEVRIEKFNEVYLRIKTEPAIARELSEFFTFQVPNASFMPSVRNRLWDGRIRLFNTATGKIYVGLFPYIRKFFQQQGYLPIEYGEGLWASRNIDKELIKKFVNKISKDLKVRDYQLDAIHHVINNDRGLILSPTGSGKSFIIYALIRYYVDLLADKKILVVVPTTSLVEQMYGDFADYGWSPEEYCHRLYSGYDKKFRHDVITTALASYRKMKENDEKGETPMYRSKMWKRRERREAKRGRKKNWYRKGGYKSVIFVPSTPISTLLRRYQQKVEESGIPIKLIEKSGQTLNNILRTSDPRKDSKCKRGDCPVCTTGGKGNCKKLNVNYRKTCECDGEYTGKHQDRLREENDKSDLWDHCKKKHAGEKKTFRMDVIESFHRDPLLRQVTEATRISRANKERSINKKEEIASTRTQWNRI